MKKKSNAPDPSTARYVFYDTHLVFCFLCRCAIDTLFFGENMCL